MKRAYALIATPLLAVALAACGESGDGRDPAGATGGQPTGGATSAPASHNDQDVMFAQMMIPHHRQAIEMSKLAPTRASMPEVKRLAKAIEAAQDPEIQKMTGWLRTWGAQPPGDAGMDHGEGHGMMPEADMHKLEGLSGRAFDKAFLKMMIDHHQGAVVMATTEQRAGAFAEAKSMAASIIRSQSAEITQMRQLLAT